ncbi:MAG: hypothetical protein J6Y78_11245 [Paludibacteraceae bacterium]|nr:hypothetical protein [Paludibacteraceae bacterium]
MMMSEKRFKLQQKNFKNKFGLENDYRATVGSLKKALENFDDDLPIGVLYDSEMAYCDLHYVFLGDDGLVRLVGD